MLGIVTAFRSRALAKDWDYDVWHTATDPLCGRDQVHSFLLALALRAVGVGIFPNLKVTHLIPEASRPKPRGNFNLNTIGLDLQSTWLRIWTASSNYSTNLSEIRRALQFFAFVNSLAST